MNKLISFFLIFCLFFQVGCWDQNQLNELSFVSGLAIDKGKTHKYELTVEFFNAPAIAPQLRGNETASIIFSLEGDTIGELAKKMNVMATRKLVYSHMRVVVISKELAREGILEFLDFFEADREIRNDFNFLVVDNTSAKDVLKINYPIQRVSSMKLHTQLTTMVKEWGGDPNIRMGDFISALLSPGREPVIAEIKVVGPPEKGNTMKNNEKIEVDTYVALDGLAVFDKMKYVGELPVKHARNFLLLQDQITKTSLTAGCGEAEKYLSARISDSKTTIKARYQNDLPVFDVTIDLEGRLETIQCAYEVIDLKAYLKLEKMLEKAFKKEMEETITLAQEKFGLDIFGFGEYMERQDNKKFKLVKDNWNDEFAKAEVNVDITIKLRRTGLISDPFLTEMEDEG